MSIASDETRQKHLAEYLLTLRSHRDLTAVIERVMIGQLWQQARGGNYGLFLTALREPLQRSKNIEQLTELLLAGSDPYLERFGRQIKEMRNGEKAICGDAGSEDGPADGSLSGDKPAG